MLIASTRDALKIVEGSAVDVTPKQSKQPKQLVPAVWSNVAAKRGQ
jgi:hypothetical protein